MKIDYGITADSSEMIGENIKYLEKLEGLYLGGNKIGDAGFEALLRKSKYLTNMEELELNSNKDEKCK